MSLRSFAKPVILFERFFHETEWKRCLEIGEMLKGGRWHILPSSLTTSPWRTDVRGIDYDGIDACWHP